MLPENRREGDNNNGIQRPIFKPSATLSAPSHRLLSVMNSFSDGSDSAHTRNMLYDDVEFASLGGLNRGRKRAEQEYLSFAEPKPCPLLQPGQWRSPLLLPSGAQPRQPGGLHTQEIYFLRSQFQWRWGEEPGSLSHRMVI
jgi:hypothetical protein